MPTSKTKSTAKKSKSTQSKTKKTASKNDQKILVIVESPAKAKTINKYLGSNYKVVASMGHIIDLPKSRLAIDVDNNFEPQYITVRGRGKQLEELKKLTGSSKMVILASDNDREGEAISYHIQNALSEKHPDVPFQRIVFHEITKDAIKDSLKNPHPIDLNKVNAQKARRVLDRLVGYNISPLLWEKVKKGLSAGRVQSVALRLICEREEEIEKFVPQEYWLIMAKFKKNNSDIFAKLAKYQGKKVDKFDIPDEKTANKIIDSLKGAKYVVESISEKDSIRKPQAPFTTSKMQQEAANKLGFTSQRTMQIAQELYEGVDIGNTRTGLITYMRTDSTRISDSALTSVRDFIKQQYGNDYLAKEVQIYPNKKGSQDAHEAIRPTIVSHIPSTIKGSLTPDQYKLYSLIWSKFVASQMSQALFKLTTLDIEANKAVFRVQAYKLVFPGFLKVYQTDFDDMDQKTIIPEVKKGEELKLSGKLQKEQKFTEPPPRYTDATIVKKLEESGIGRPSTYAPTLTTLLKRFYVNRKGKVLIPTQLGKLTNELVVKNFPDIIEVDFTAKMEDQLDDVEESEQDWVTIIRSFYDHFTKEVERAKKNVADMRNVLDEPTDEVCEKCGSPMVKKLGRHGYFLACSAFPKCRNAKPIPLGECPVDNCDGKLVRKKGKGKNYFYGCSNYPDCTFVSWDPPVEQKCPKCQKQLFEKKTKDRKKLIYCVDEKCGYEEIKS